MTKALLILAPIVLLAACGSKKQLARPAGDPVPPVPAGERTAPTSDDLITSDDQARPQRNDEILRQSEKRTDDKFDMPPS